MTNEQFETLKGLIADVEIQAIVYGRKLEAHDACESYKMAPHLENIAKKQFVKWGQASSKLHDFIEGLK